MSIDTELTCQELVEVVTGYLEGTKLAEERYRFEEHLAECPGCEAYLSQMRSTIRLLGGLAVGAKLASPEARSRRSLRARRT